MKLSSSQEREVELACFISPGFDALTASYTYLTSLNAMLEDLNYLLAEMKASNQSIKDIDAMLYRKTRLLERKRDLQAAITFFETSDNH